MLDRLGSGSDPTSSEELVRRSGALDRHGSESPRSSARHPAPDDDLRYYWDVLRRRRRLVVGLVLVLVVGTAAGTLLSPPSYEASGLLEIRSGDADMEGRENPFREQNVTEEYLLTQYGILESKAVARKVVETLRLDTLPRAATDDAARDDSSALQKVVEKIRSGLEVDPREGSRLVEVRYEADDPAFAAAVVNAALNGYVDVRVQDGREVVSWLSRQVDSTKAELRQSERELRAYAREHDLPVLETAGEGTETVLDQRLRSLEEELTDARADRIAAESKYRQVVAEHGREAVDNRVVQDLVVELAELRREHARLTTLFQESYPKAREVERQIARLEEELAREKARVADRLESEFRTARRREELLQQSIDEQRELGRRMADESGQYRLLRREVENSRKLLAAFQQARKEAEVSAALLEARFGIVDLAEPPRSPEGPGLPQNLALALVAGLMVGVGAAFARERLEATSAPAGGGDARLGPRVLALISGSDGDGDLLMDQPNHAGAREIPSGPYGALQAELFDEEGTGAGSLLVTSPQPQERAAGVAADLAGSVAASGRRILLVDADLRRPSLNGSPIDGTHGLWDHLERGESWRSLVLPGTVEGLDVLPAGLADGDAAAALGSTRMQDFLAEAEAEYDCVIVDSAALFVEEADARILFSMVDGVLLVIRHGGTPLALARRVMEKAPRAWAVVVGDSGELELAEPMAPAADRTGTP